jgi:hypothetical protein
MRKCPACDKWTMDFDEYFGRFRCHNPDCQWMPASSAERRIRRTASLQPLKPLLTEEIPGTGLTLTASYDRENRIVLFDFGIEEPAFDLPESDGQLIWRIGRHTGQVVGFNINIIDPKTFKKFQIRIDIEARKRQLENTFRKDPSTLNSGRITKAFIERIQVAVEYTPEKRATRSSPLENFVRNTIENVKHHELAAATS